MARQPGDRRLPLVATLVAAVLLLALPLAVTDEYYLHVFIGILYFAFMASAWNIVCGYTGQLSLGHSALCGIGSIPGCILGGLVLGIVESVAAQFVTATSASIFSFMIFILVLFFRPTGLLGMKV